MSEEMASKGLEKYNTVVPDHIKAPENLEFRPSRFNLGFTGVFCTTSVIPMGTLLGPYFGKVMSKRQAKNLDFRFAWEVVDLDTLIPQHILDSSDPLFGNWMRYVCSARFLEEQNIVTTQQDNEIFYKAIRNIKPGEELLTWFQQKGINKNIVPPVLPEEQTESQTCKEDRPTVEQTARPVDKPTVQTGINTQQNGKSFNTKERSMSQSQMRKLHLTTVDEKIDTQENVSKIMGNISGKLPGSKSEKSTNSISSLVPNSTEKTKNSIATMECKSPQKSKNSITNLLELSKEKSPVKKSPEKAKSPEKLKRKRKPKVFPDAYREEPGMKKARRLLDDDLFEPLQPGQKRRRRKKFPAESTSSTASDSPAAPTIVETVDKVKVSNPEVNRSSTASPESENKSQTVALTAINDSVDWTYPKVGQDFQFEIQPQHITYQNGKKIFQCDICNGLYKHTFSLKRHYLRNHINYRFLSKADITNCLINLSQVIEAEAGSGVNDDNGGNESGTVENQSSNTVTNFSHGGSEIECDDVFNSSKGESDNDYSEMKECVKEEQLESESSVNKSQSCSGEDDPEKDLSNSQSQELKSNRKLSLGNIVIKTEPVDIEENPVDTASGSMFMNSADSKTTDTDGVEGLKDTLGKTEPNMEEFANLTVGVSGNPNPKLKPVTFRKGLFRCNVCFKLFDTVDDIRRHTEDHPQSPGVMPFACDICSMRFSYKQNLVRHQAVHQAEENTISGGKLKGLKGCGKRKKRREKEASCDEDKKFQCARCRVTFNDLQSLVKHQAIHKSDSGRLKFSCQYCGKDFPSMANMKKHVRFHLGYRISCRYCTEVYPNVGALRKHIRISHPDIYKAKQMDKIARDGVLRRPDKKTIGVVKLDKKQKPAKNAWKDRDLSSMKQEFVETFENLEMRENYGYDHDVSFAADEIDDGGSRFKFSCTICKKRFSNYINMCRHRRRTHGNESKQKTDENSNKLTSRRTQNLPPIEETPEMIALFYANVSNNIATNLSSYIDGRPDSLEKFEDHIKVEGYVPAVKCVASNFDNPGLSWDTYNFPPDFRPGKTISFREIRQEFDIHSDFDVQNNVDGDRVNNMEVTEVVDIEAEVHVEKEDNVKCISEESVWIKGDGSALHAEKVNCEDTCSETVGNTPEALNSRDNSDEVINGAVEYRGGEDHGMCAVDTVKLEETDSEADKRGVSVKQESGEDVPMTGVQVDGAGIETNSEKKSPVKEKASTAKSEEKACLELNEVKQLDQLEKTNSHNSPHDETLMLKSDQKRELLTETSGESSEEKVDSAESLVPCPVARKLSCDSQSSGECTNQDSSLFNTLSLSVSQKEGEINDTNVPVREIQPDYSDAPNRSPSHNYDKIAFGLHGKVTAVCAICRKHFRDFDCLIRHHWKKHPSSVCNYIEVEQGHEIDSLYYSEPSNIGALAVTDWGLESSSERDAFTCTRCGSQFKSVSRLHVHIVSCAPVDLASGEVKTDKKLKSPLKKKVKKVKEGQSEEPQLKLKIKDLSAYQSKNTGNEVKSRKRIFMGCRKRKAVILPDSPIRLLQRKNQDVGYNPQNHIRRRELTEVLDTHQCEACGHKFKSISLLERHVKKCTNKEKFKDLHPMKCPIMEESLAKLKHECFYCKKNFTYMKSLINHFQDFCPVKKEKLERSDLSEEDKTMEAKLVETMRLQEEEKLKMLEEAKETNGVGKRKAGWPRGLKRKNRRKGHAWTYIKRKKSTGAEQMEQPVEEDEMVVNEQVDDDVEKEDGGIDNWDNEVDYEDGNEQDVIDNGVACVGQAVKRKIKVENEPLEKGVEEDPGPSELRKYLEGNIEESSEKLLPIPEIQPLLKDKQNEELKLLKHEPVQEKESEAKESLLKVALLEKDPKVLSRKCILLEEEASKKMEVSSKPVQEKRNRKKEEEKTEVSKCLPADAEVVVVRPNRPVINTKPRSPKLGALAKQQSHDETTMMDMDSTRVGSQEQNFPESRPSKMFSPSKDINSASSTPVKGKRGRKRKSTIEDQTTASANATPVTDDTVTEKKQRLANSDKARTHDSLAEDSECFDTESKKRGQNKKQKDMKAKPKSPKKDGKGTILEQTECRGELQETEQESNKQKSRKSFVKKLNPDPADNCDKTEKLQGTQNDPSICNTTTKLYDKKPEGLLKKQRKTSIKHVDSPIKEENLVTALKKETNGYTAKLIPKKPASEQKSKSPLKNKLNLTLTKSESNDIVTTVNAISTQRSKKIEAAQTNSLNKEKVAGCNPGKVDTSPVQKSSKGNKTGKPVKSVSPKRLRGVPDGDTSKKDTKVLDHAYSKVKQSPVKRGDRKRIAKTRIKSTSMKGKLKKVKPLDIVGDKKQENFDETHKLLDALESPEPVQEPFSFPKVMEKPVSGKKGKSKRAGRRSLKLETDKHASEEDSSVSDVSR